LEGTGSVTLGRLAGSGCPRRGKRERASSGCRRYEARKHPEHRSQNSAAKKGDLVIARQVNEPPRDRCLVKSSFQQLPMNRIVADAHGLKPELL
jgi:hypothetical protein